MASKIWSILPELFALRVPLSLFRYSRTGDGRRQKHFILGGKNKNSVILGKEKIKRMQSPTLGHMSMLHTLQVATESR